MKIVKIISFAVISSVLIACTHTGQKQENIRWSEAQANQWYQKKGWLVGVDYTPRTAINQLEMWQAESFDPETIDQELGWAEELGFNSIRVFLHDLLWKQDSAGFLKRMDKFLDIADSHHIGVMFVLFDGVWNPHPKLGKQPAPTPHVHNSGWVQSPGAEILADTSQWGYLEEYVKGVLGHFSKDARVDVWDLFNEPDNTNNGSYGDVELPNKKEQAMLLLKKTYTWAREINPSQPLTAGLWYGNWSAPDSLKPMDRYMIEHSDVISFHCYDPPEILKQKIASLKRYNRPLLCTEYMARPRGSTFAAALPILKENNVGAYNWGFVNGKTQTIYPWDSWAKTYTGEPEVWFHDILRKDGTSYDSSEVALIKSLTK